MHEIVYLEFHSEILDQKDQLLNRTPMPAPEKEMARRASDEAMGLIAKYGSPENMPAPERERFVGWLKYLDQASKSPASSPGATVLPLVTGPPGSIFKR